MSLFDFINKAQASVDQLQKKAEELQARANQFANGLGMSTPIPDDVDLDDAPVAISNRYTCPICGNHQESGKKNTVYGEICANCVQALKDKDITPREVRRFTQEQIYGLCDPSVNAMEAANRFAIPNSSIALKSGEQCFYAGRACGGKIKTITTGYTGASKGYSLHLMKNFTYRSGGSASQAVRQQVLEKIRDGRRRVTPMGEMPILSGMLFCADCGAKLYQVRGRGWEHSKEYFVCATYRKIKGGCNSHQIRNVVIEEALLDDIRRITAFAKDHEKRSSWKWSRRRPGRPWTEV